MVDHVEFEQAWLNTVGFLGTDTAKSSDVSSHVDIYYVDLWRARGGNLAGAGILAATPQVHLCQFAHPFLVLGAAFDHSDQRGDDHLLHAERLHGG